MSASKNRIDWALLMLRVAVGAMAILHGLDVLHRSGISVALSHLSGAGFTLLMGLLELVCGALLVVGVWTVPAGLGTSVIILLPLIHGWPHGVLGTSAHPILFRILTTLASALGGPGKLSLSK